jgi:iron complex outermembrane receptor protein
VVAKSFPTFDLERIEMLRGPQGTLFGRNTPAGVVKMVSRRPTEETEGFVRAAYGTYAQTTVEAALSGKLDPDSDLSARAATTTLPHGCSFCGTRPTTFPLC